MAKVRRIRKSFIVSEKDERQKIDTGSLADGGKKNPTGLPGGSEILPEEEKTQDLLNPKKETNLEKIENVQNYNPKEISNEVLRDDFRIVLAWYSTWRNDPHNFKYDEKTLHELLKKILREAKSRGKEFITFHPNDMDKDVSGFFELVAEEVGIPNEQIEKQLKLTPSTNPEKLTLDELKEAHWKLHIFYRDMSKGKEIANFSTEDLVNLHALIVDELYRRDTKHPAPPDDGLDDNSSTFENYVESQPKWTEVKKYQFIAHSGNEIGEEITLEQVLPYFETFKLRKPYIYLVGGLANHGKTKGDIDILVKDSPDLPEAFKHALHFRLGRALPEELSKRLSIHYDEFYGPFTNYCELFDLTFERVNPANEVKLMRDKDFIIKPIV